MAETKARIYEDYEINEEFAEKWMQKYGNDGEIHALFSTLEGLGQKAFPSAGKSKMQHIKMKFMPLNLTDDIFIQIYRKQ